MTTAPEAPTVIPAVTEISGGAPPDQSFKDIFNAPADAPVKDIPKKDHQKSKDTPVKGTEKPVGASKPSGKDKVPEGGQKDVKEASSRWDKLDELKKPEEGKEGEDADPTKPDAKDDSSQSTEAKEADQKEQKDQSRWMQLKAAEKKLLALEPEHEATKKELEDFKVKGFIPEETKARLERLEQRYAEEILESDEGFQREVTIPIDKSFKTIGEVAKSAGLSGTASQALINAVRNLNEVERSDAIWDIISSAKVKEKDEDGEVQEVPLADDKVTRYATKIVATADALHNIHWKRDVEYRDKAREIADSIRGKDVEETAQQRVSKEEEFSKEAKHLSTILQEKMPLVFEQHPEALEAIQNARPSKELGDQVFDAQSGHLVHFLSKTLNNTLSELYKAKASLKAREAAKPRSGDGSAQAPKKEEQGISFQEAFGGR